jgi:hypothetical protein
LEENQPQQAGAKRHQAGVEKGKWAYFGFKPESHEYGPGDESENSADQETKHPHREK